MGKTRGVHETTPELRNRMVGMYEAGLGLREIADAVNCSQRTVKRWLNRFDKEGTVETRERCGRKRATTAEQDEAIVRLVTQTQITAAKAVLPVLGLNCSVDTIRERLHKAGIHNWSPSRKYMRKIPLGETDSAAILQPMWRPTGTQLGKKKSRKDTSKTDRNTTALARKKSPAKKSRTKDAYVGDGAPEEGVEPGEERRDFMYEQRNVPQPRVAEIHPLHPSQTGFDGGPSVPQQVHPVVYPDPALNISQTWPLDLVQESHHYPQNPANAISREQAPAPHQLQDLHTREEQSRHRAPPLQQSQQTIAGDPIDHRHCDRLNPPLSSPRIGTNLSSDPSRARPSRDSNRSSGIESDGNGDTSNDGDAENEGRARRKKGGKAKGTLETSVEIRNRMIGMSEAGLSTLSIALAIDRSERTVKRWLNRWHKEGNVQTKERKGRRRITTKEQDEAIVAMATQQPLTAAKHVAPALGLKCSVDTIRERLHKAGIHSWKLGRKQGEGNAVHTVHLWQPSGNRSSKAKLSADSGKRSIGGRRRQGDRTCGSGQKRSPVKQRRTESTGPTKVVASSGNAIPENTAALPFQTPPAAMANCVSDPNALPANNPAHPPPIVHSEAHPSCVQRPQPQSQPQHSMHSRPMVGPMTPPRSDCRLAAAIVTPVSIQGNTAVVTRPSCMVIANNSQTGNTEQPDPLNFEPYIWSF